MGEAKRRQKYWAKQGQTPPPQQGKASSKNTTDALKQKINQIKTDTARVKKDPEFKQQCQEKFATENRKLKAKLEQRDFSSISDIIATIQERSGKLSPEQVELWIDYLISGLLDTKNIAPLQAQLFVWELASKLQLDSQKSQKEYKQLSEEIAVTTAYLKSLEVWINLPNDLLAIYQVRSVIR